MLTLSAVASAALAAPQGTSELVDAAAMEYVPPATEYLPATDEQGYEYRAVRRLKLRHRNRRDVSHLPLAPQYLPPPSNRYLPPTAAAPAPAAVLADDTEEIVSAAEPKVARDYLPPAEEPVASTEAPVPETEAPPAEEQPVQPDVRVADVPTAELRDDGYHYKQPVEMPAELKESAQAYLPPLGDDVVADGPANGESSVLTKDGYQYRAIRRYRF